MPGRAPSIRRCADTDGRFLTRRRAARRRRLVCARPAAPESLRARSHRRPAHDLRDARARRLDPRRGGDGAGARVHRRHGRQRAARHGHDLGAVIDAVHRAPFPVLAAVHGACLGAGFELALACDLRVAAADASFGLPEVRVGVPSVIQAALLPPLIGPGRAAEMLLLGTPVDAPRALAWGLVNRVVDAAALATVVDETLAALLACAPGAVRAQKALMIRWRETDLPSAVRAGIDAFAACYTGDEPREGAAAFLEKRAPRFGGRVR